MAVAYDALSDSTLFTSTPDPKTWTHTPTGTPKGVIVACFSKASSDLFTGAVTYGGVAMTAVSGGVAVDTATEVMSTKLYFLGAGVPSGAQTVSVDHSGAATDKRCVCITVTAATTNTKLSGTPALLQENQAISEQAVNSGSDSALRFGFVQYGGLGSAIAAGASSTELLELSSWTGTQSISVTRETTGGSGSRSVGSSAVSDDAAAVHIAIAERVDTTVTPSTASLTTATFAPTVTIPANQLVTPSTASLTLATFAPTVTASDHQTVTPTTASLTTSTFAPVVKLVVTPTTATVALATFAPTVTASDHQTVTPTTASLSATTFEPTVSATAHQVVTPTPVDLATTAFAPTVSLTDNQLVTPDVAALTLATFAATVTASDHKTATPDVAALALTTFAPTVDAFQGTTVQPDSADLTLTTFAPVAALSDNQTVTAGVAALSLATFAPVVTALAPQLAVPAPASLALTTFAPLARVTGPIDFIGGDLDAGTVVDGDLESGPSFSGSVGATRVRARLVISPPPASGSIDVD